MTTTYTATCRQSPGDFPRWYLESDGWGHEIGRASQFDSDLVVHRVAAGYIAQRLGLAPTGLDHLIREGLAPSGSWTAAGYKGAFPIYQVVVPDLYLSTTEVAQRIGVSRATVSKYRLPPPDATIGGVRGWLPETIDRWQAQRPGQGARTDLGAAEMHA